MERDLNQWLPIVKWLLAIPHFIILAVLWIALVIAVLISWVSSYSRAATRWVCSIL